MGPVTTETWPDERGIVRKGTFKMPFGTMAWDLE
jgi:hypothetical protein